MNEPTNAQILDGLVQLTQAVSDYMQENDAHDEKNPAGRRGSSVLSSRWF